MCAKDTEKRHRNGVPASRFACIFRSMANGSVRVLTGAGAARVFRADARLEKIEIFDIHWRTGPMLPSVFASG